MIFSFRQWRRRRILKRHIVAESTWHTAETGLISLQGLNDEERLRIRQLATLFVHEKHLEVVGDLSLSESMQLRLALQACVPILNLGLDWYTGWTAVVIYPDEFISDHEEIDEAGVVHRVREIRSGEAWLHGPIVLSWSDVQGGHHWHGHNVVIHEMAHKLDMLNGDTNGLPPLHANMAIKHWAEAFSRAFADFSHRVDGGEDTFIDPYASESPGEFFAVLSEVFFEAPDELHTLYPDVYRLLAAFYKQDPLTRQAQPLATP
jgi:Mlc titration factor MtfA (ptsG expression regulator)